MTFKRRTALGLLTCALALAVASVPMAAAEEPANAFSGLASIPASALGEARGADSSTVIVSSEQDFEAAVHGSSYTVGTMNNGAISIGENAFDGFSGVGVVNANTGNNNAFSIGVSMSVHLH